MEDKTFTVIDENGNETLCEIIFTFHSDEFKKNYVIYTMPGKNDSDEVEVSAACYEESSENEGALKPIETDEEWELVESILEEYEEEEDEEENENEA
ncbi:hypothetical protein AwErysi_00730 [Erysipelotrichaceae bacterium]|nr:hypothetical protein AwErysi_00730 [Erysipelotrichaceae bacterium]